MQEIVTMEQQFLLWIQDYVRCGMLTPLMKGITTLGNAGMIWIILSAAMLARKKTRKTGITAVVALLLSLLVNNLILKNAVARIRPYDAVQALQPLVARPSDFSFPSGHTASSFAAAAVFFRELPRRWGVLFLILASLIAVSRLYVGVHYPTDVIFGMISGILLGFTAEKLVILAEKKIRISGKKATTE